MNFRRSFRYAFFISVVYFPALLNAQTNPYGEVSIASPTAASLGKYADIPVSYHTGIPQIDIPLYTIKAGPLEMPISLSYHASGLKVLETASWVGAGWSLNAGGMITRTVMGQPDEQGTSSGHVNTDGYYSNNGYNNYLYLSGNQDWLGFAQNQKDGEPDLYFFNFGSYTGKFFFRDDHTPILVPQQDITIIPYFPTLGSSIQGFTVITPDGTKYYFGNTPGYSGNATEITNPFSSEAGYASGTAISSWFLNKVMSVDSLFSINYRYTAENYGYYTISPGTLDTYSPYTVQPFNLVKNIIAGVRLDTINFPNGSVYFNPGPVRSDLSNNGSDNNDYANTNATSLGSIGIASSDGTFCKQFKFFTSYFTDNTTLEPNQFSTAGYNLQTDEKRLRLDSIQESSCDNLLQIPSRKFKYFSEAVPRRLTLGQDHWGFINGATSNQGLLPTYTTNDGIHIVSIPGANRDASWPAMRGGALNQITYPTGGTATFDFEPADSYIYTSTSLQSVYLASAPAHEYGQDTSYSSTVSIVSAGSMYPVLISVQNNTSYLLSVVIRDHNNNIVYSNNDFPDNTYPTAQTTTDSVTLAAGTYSAKLTVPTGPPDGQGGLASYYQVQYVTNNIPVTIGGLRIKTITQKDSVNNGLPIITSYTYPSGGFLYSFPTYVSHIRNDLVTQLGFYDVTTGFTQGYGSNSGCPLSGSYYLRSGGSLRPMATSQGYHIGYATVNVTQSGNGYSSYHYYTSNSGYGAQSLNPDIQSVNTSANTCEAQTPNYPPAPLPFDYRKGELYYEQHYNQAGQLLKDAYYYPQYDTSTQQPAPGFIVASRTNTNQTQILFGTIYNLYSPRRTSTVVYSTDYTGGNPLGVQTTKTTYYGSTYHNQVTKEAVTTSIANDTLFTNTKYTSDFHNTAWDISPSCETTYTNSCSSCQTTLNSANTACAGSASCLVTAFAAYRQCISNARNSYVASRLTNYTGRTVLGLDSNSYQRKHDSTKNLAGTELKPILDLQDEKRVLPIEVSNYREASLLKSDFTRFDYSPSSTTVPYPNKTQLISLQNPGSTLTNATISGNTITKDSRYLDESVYAFLKGNPAAVTPRSGIVTMYLWDYLKTNPIAKTTFSSIDSTAFTSFEADGNGNWNVPSTVRDSSTSMTGRYCYNLTHGAVTRTGLTSGKKYTISYWSKGGSYTIAGASSTTTTGRAALGWTYYEQAITTTGSTVTLSGSGQIDELRMYPQGAQMSSYTYKRLVGITSMNDPNSEITFYEYDGLERLINIKDYLGNTLKNYQYNYANASGSGCGLNCSILPMQTFIGTNTLSYPVGVFNLNGKLIANAVNQGQYITLWMSDTVNTHIGTLEAGSDSMHFKFTVNTGKAIPNSVTGCRYYQYDLPYTQIDAVRNSNGVYVDYGDGTGMRLGVTTGDSNVVRAPNTVINVQYGYSTGIPYIYWIHSYPDSTTKAITFYHNDAMENMGLDNAYAPANALIRIRNLRGNLPQNTTYLGGDCNQQSTALTVASIANWNSISSVTSWALGTGDVINPCLHISYAQDFMSNNQNLQSIVTNSRGYYLEGYEDTTFKISRLKSNWNTYFTNLTTLEIDDNHWNHENLSSLTHLSLVGIGSANTLNSYSQTGNPLIPITTTVIDNIINQISSGAGQVVSNGLLNIPSGGGTRSSASDASITALKAKGWTIYVNGTAQ